MIGQRNGCTKGSRAHMGGGGGSQGHVGHMKTQWKHPGQLPVLFLFLFEEKSVIFTRSQSKWNHHTCFTISEATFLCLWKFLHGSPTAPPPPLLCSFNIFITAELVQKWNWVLTYPDHVLVFLPVWFLILRKLIFALATYKTRVKGNLRKIIQDANASINYSRTNNRLTLHLGIMYPAFLSTKIRGTSHIKAQQPNSKNVTKHTFGNVCINYWTHPKVTKLHSHRIAGTMLSTY